MSHKNVSLSSLLIIVSLLIGYFASSNPVKSLSPMIPPLPPCMITLTPDNRIALYDGPGKQFNVQIIQRPGSDKFVNALGRTSDDNWILIIFTRNQITGWVLKEFIQCVYPLDRLPQLDGSAQSVQLSPLQTPSVIPSALLTAQKTIISTMTITQPISTPGMMQTALPAPVTRLVPTALATDTNPRFASSPTPIPTATNSMLPKPPSDKNYAVATAQLAIPTNTRIASDFGTDDGNGGGDNAGASPSQNISSDYNNAVVAPGAAIPTNTPIAPGLGTGDGNVGGGNSDTSAQDTPFPTDTPTSESEDNGGNVASEN